MNSSPLPPLFFCCCWFCIIIFVTLSFREATLSFMLLTLSHLMGSCYDWAAIYTTVAPAAPGGASLCTSPQRIGYNQSVGLKLEAKQKRSKEKTNRIFFFLRRRRSRRRSRRRRERGGRGGKKKRWQSGGGTFKSGSPSSNHRWNHRAGYMAVIRDYSLGHFHQWWIH